MFGCAMVQTVKTDNDMTFEPDLRKGDEDESCVLQVTVDVLAREKTEGYDDGGKASWKETERGRRPLELLTICRQLLSRTEQSNYPQQPSQNTSQNRAFRDQKWDKNSPSEKKYTLELLH